MKKVRQRTNLSQLYKSMISLICGILKNTTNKKQTGEQPGVPHWGERRRRGNTGAESKEVQIIKYKIRYKDSL